MVKKILGQNNIFEFTRSIYDFSCFSKSFSRKSLLIYVIVMIFMVSLISALKGMLNNASFGVIQSFISTLLGSPILILFIFIFIYIVIMAFERKGDGFFQDLLVFSAIILPFLFIAHFLSFLNLLFLSSIVFNILMFFLIIYLLINIVLVLKYYYNINSYRIIFSLIIFYLIIFLLIINLYLSGAILG